MELQKGGGQAFKERLIDREPQELVALGGEVGRPLVGHKLEECLQAMTVNLEQVPEPAGGSGEVCLLYTSPSPRDCS